MSAGKTARVLLLLALLSITPRLFAFVGGGQNVGESTEVEATGRVRLVGTSRFPSLVITDGERDLFIDDAEREKLMDLQQQVVTVRARKYTYEVFLANGLLSLRYYILKDLVIVRIAP